MTSESKILRIEFTAIVLLWVLAFALPVLFVDEFNSNWRGVYVMWAEFSVIGIAFLINRFLLMPKLFFTKKYAKYIICISALLIILSVFILYFDGVNTILSLFGAETIQNMPSREGMPPMGGGMPPMGGGAPHGNMPPMGGGHHGGVMTPTAIPISVIPPDLNVVILLLIVIALDLGLSIAIKWIISEHKQSEMKRDRVSMQLSNLQNQISPHFFMNTLNNIHALVEIDPQRAQKTIIELSGLMDYLLYESSTIEKVSLPQELNFTTSYINLMRLRYPKRVKIDFICGEVIPSIKIPPLLFLNFIENTFKYGVDYNKESFIKISFNFTDTEIEMTTENSNHSATVKNRHGLGISNSRKRLKLLYGNKFTLNITDSEGVYHVNLKIPII